MQQYNQEQVHCPEWVNILSKELQQKYKWEVYELRNTILSYLPKKMKPTWEDIRSYAMRNNLTVENSEAIIGYLDRYFDAWRF